MAQWTLNYTTYDNSQWTSVIGNVIGGMLGNLPWAEENLPNFRNIELNVVNTTNLTHWENR